MKCSSLLPAAVATIAALAITSHTFADSGIPAVTYTENFDTTAHWSTTSPGETAPTLVIGGGVGGGNYVSTTNVATNSQPDLPPPAGPIPVILLRAQVAFASSDHKFENNWITAGISNVTAYVRQDTPGPLTYFARFTSTSSPTGVVFLSAPVSPGSEWTKLTFELDPTSPLFVSEGPSFASTMSDVGRLQLGFQLPVGFGSYPNNSFTFGLDQVSWNVPEPASWMLVSLAGMVLGLVRRPKRAKS